MTIAVDRSHSSCDYLSEELFPDNTIQATIMILVKHSPRDDLC